MEKKGRKYPVSYIQKFTQVIKPYELSEFQNRQELCLVMSGWAGLRRHIYKTSKGKFQ